MRIFPKKITKARSPNFGTEYDYETGSLRTNKTIFAPPSQYSMSFSQEMEDIV